MTRLDNIQPLGARLHRVYGQAVLKQRLQGCALLVAVVVRDEADETALLNAISSLRRPEKFCRAAVGKYSLRTSPTPMLDQHSGSKLREGESQTRPTKHANQLRRAAAVVTDGDNIPQRTFPLRHDLIKDIHQEVRSSSAREHRYASLRSRGGGGLWGVRHSSGLVASIGTCKALQAKFKSFESNAYRNQRCKRL